MAEYRLYYLDVQDHIMAAENFEVADDREAIACAQDLCCRNVSCHGVELWQGARLVHSFTRPEVR
jgi:hypothetical protein